MMASSVGAIMVENGSTGTRWIQLHHLTDLCPHLLELLMGTDRDQKQAGFRAVGR
jgi:hypothetical protein